MVAVVVIVFTVAAFGVCVVALVFNVIFAFIKVFFEKFRHMFNLGCLLL